ncbi:SDR family oxidoreductase [Chloroflexia bacterium SDU3-3]|nr:SDR family oxidoreductase [Chloroflexia bacterium SDU3-3]
MNQQTQRALVLAGLGAGVALALRRSQQRYELEGKVALITGGSRGLGLVLARQLVSQGARVAIVARDGVELAQAEADLRARGGDVLAFPCDVRSHEAATLGVQRVVAHFGRLDILINNAGVIGVGPLEHLTLEDFDTAIQTHIYGPLHMMLAAIPHMRQQGQGRIANIASVGGRVAVPHLIPYTASKFGLVGLSDGMRAELAKDNIKVSTICPGLMRAGSHVNAQVKGNHQAEYAWFSVIDALPFTSVAVEHAAAQIIRAVRHGSPHLTISPQAKLLGALGGVAPNLLAQAMNIVGQALPGYAGPEGDVQKTGRESESPIAPSVLTSLNDRAAERNNQHGKLSLGNSAEA